jgi:hypothetical protein
VSLDRFRTTAAFPHHIVSLSILWCLDSSCRWEELNQAVYNALVNDIMKPRIDEVSDDRTCLNFEKEGFWN